MTNWTDFKENEDLSKVDKLDLLFVKQSELMQKYGIASVNINTQQGQNTIRAISMHLIEELCEIMHCLKNKNWVSYETEVDMPAMLDEVADLTHFYIEVMILLNQTPESLVQLYLKKHKTNLARIETKY